MSDETWIKLYRKSIKSGWLTNHKLWTFWCYCLMKATHKEHKQLVGSQQVVLQPGQFIFGLKKASKELRLTIQSVRTCRDNLKKLGNLTIKSTNKFSIISIINWDSYQQQKNGNQQSNQHMPNMQPTIKHQKTNNKQEYKKNKNGKKEDKEVVEKEDFSTAVISTVDFFITKLEEKEKPNNGQYLNWCESVEKCNRIDKYSFEDIRRIIENTKADDFWTPNFLSLTKLRRADKNGVKFIVVFDKIKNNQTAKCDISKILNKEN